MCALNNELIRKLVSGTGLQKMGITPLCMSLAKVFNCVFESLPSTCSSHAIPESDLREIWG